MKLFEFMTTHKLAGAEFSGPSWSTWRVIARLIDGDAHLLAAEEQELALRLTGRTVLPSTAPREVYIGAGRRGGKSRFSALVATWLAARSYPQLAAGESARIVNVAPDQEQAELDLDYARGIVDESELLRSALVRNTRRRLEFAHKTRLEVATASFRTVRGRTLAGAVVDESAYLRAENSALPDVELMHALKPALLTTRGLLLVISSPHRKLGVLYEAHRKYFGNDDEQRCLYIQATSRELNPSLNEEDIAEIISDDPSSGQSEFMGLFRDDLQTFLDDKTVDSQIVPGRRLLPKTAGCRYVAFADPSGGKSDAFTLAIAHRDERPAKDYGGKITRIVLDALDVRQPKFDPENVVSEMAELLKEYGLSEVHGDRFGGEWVESMFRKFGVRYVPSERSRSEIYLETLPLFMQGKIELLDIPLLRTQLLLLERKTHGAGRDSVDHPRGAHDDAANAACGALHLAGSKSRGLNISDAALDVLAAAQYGEGMMPRATTPGGTTLGPQYAHGGDDGSAFERLARQMGAVKPGDDAPIVMPKKIV